MRNDAKRLMLLAVLLLIGLVHSAPCRAQAPQSGDKGEATTPADEEDLGDLAKELEAAEGDTAAAAAAAANAMETYESRARQAAEEARTRLLKNPRWNPTHKLVKRLTVSAPLNNMCLDAQGRILACCGDKMIRVLSANGELQTTYSLDFTPEAISVRHGDGVIFVGGAGQLAKLGPDGTVQSQIAFPPPPSEEEKKAMMEGMLKQVDEQIKQMQQMAEGIKKQLDEVKKQLATTPPTEEETKKTAAISEDELFNRVSGITMTGDRLEMLFTEGTPITVKARALEYYLKSLGGVDLDEQRRTMEQQVRSQVETRSETSRFTGLAVGTSDLFVICSGPGYSYNAWRMTPEFGESKVILSGLRGCCGQLDCQTYDGKLWLAMNTEHQVVCYDRDGQKLSAFGKNDGEAADGFGGCCEPKNLRFSPDGKYVYAAQSGPPVCVKRFTLDGEFQDVVCFPVYETGCVRVSVDVDEDTFFLMSPDDSAIYMFQPQ